MKPAYRLPPSIWVMLLVSWILWFAILWNAANEFEHLAEIIKICSGE